MIDPNVPVPLTTLLPFVAPLLGVVLGAGLTWLVQRNEWGRQRRWELRRDTTLDAVRALADLEDALMALNNAFQQPTGTPTEDAQAELTNRRIQAMRNHQEKSSAFKRAHIVIDLSVGGNLSKRLSEYFQIALPQTMEVITKRDSCLTSEQIKVTALKGNEVVMAAREAVGIQDAGQLPLPEKSKRP